MDSFTVFPGQRIERDMMVPAGTDKIRLSDTVVSISPSDAVQTVWDGERPGEKSFVATKLGVVRVKAPKLPSGKKSAASSMPSAGPSTAASQPKLRIAVDSSYRRYVPKEGDTVVGVVVERGAENYRVSLGGSRLTQLPVLAFDGASKRNKPNLLVGTLVYARIARVDRDLAPELSCAVVSGPKKDWVTGESVFGELVGGTTVQVPLHHARRLVSSKSEVLPALGRHFPFEVCAGLNGLVWVKAASAARTVLVSLVVQRSVTVPEEAAGAFVDTVVAAAGLRAAAGGRRGPPASGSGSSGAAAGGAAAAEGGQAPMS